MSWKYGIYRKHWLTALNSPTIRPANQRYQQPSFVFPITPPSTAGLDALLSPPDGDERQRNSEFTLGRSPSTPTARVARDLRSPPVQTSSQHQQPPSTRHKRAMSYSTIDENNVVRDSDAGAFKVIIERPSEIAKAPAPFVGIPTLEVPIPSYKLGTPRFSTRGTAMLRSSCQTATDDVRSSIFSSQRDPSSHRPTKILSRRHSDASWQPHFDRVSSSALDPFDSTILPTGVVKQRGPIGPEMFDSLTFKPACDHPSVVRYSLNGGIRAATPARLVSEITSPKFVDYDLLSDFFLTFRSFLDTNDLLHLLIARLKWALTRDDEVGAVVRVRTFVAIRHWILNYFLEDYVVNYKLRKAFCDLLNTFGDDVSFSPASAKVPQKILGELKKCWRRVCAAYWDGSDFDTDLGPDVLISPGGVAGSRNPNMDPSFSEKSPPQIEEGVIEQDPFGEQEWSSVEDRKFFADVSRPGHLGDAVHPEYTQTGQQADALPEPPLSPTSMVSEDFVSCSFPPRPRTIGTANSPGAHPVPTSSIHDHPPPIALTPKALTGKRVRPTHSHKRSGSFSDSFRDRRTIEQPVPKAIYQTTELFVNLPYAGNLVRGNLFPPGQAVVDAVAPSTPADINNAPPFSSTTRAQKAPGAMSGPGMKKLLSSVRRALSTRTGGAQNSNASPTQGSFPHIPPLGARGATMNRLPGTAIVPQARPRNVGGKAPMRIDLLGAEIAEDFKKAVEEEAEAEAAHRGLLQARSDDSSQNDVDRQYSTMTSDTTLDPVKLDSRTALVSGMTNGSKSIVIVDDTIPSGDPPTKTALPMNPSVDTFADAFLHQSSGPTPPSTPPEVPFGTPRRSSHLLGQHSRNRSVSLEGKSFVESLNQFGDDDHFRSPRSVGRPSMHSQSRTFRSKKSLSLRRYASYHSGFAYHRSEKSFDATTFSGSEEPEHLSQPVAPRPLRVLRRRPGGDLRAVTNVGDLNSQPLRRPMSTGSLTTYSDSVRSSYLQRESSVYVDVIPVGHDQQAQNAQTFSLGALAEASQNRPRSLVSTHSSQPIMRPSFEKEAQLLAQIPDDINDDGGVASALLKLEGKYEQRHSDASSRSYVGVSADRGGSFGVRPLNVRPQVSEDSEVEVETRRQRHEQVVDSSLPQAARSVSTHRPQHHSSGEELKPTVYQPPGVQVNVAETSSRSVTSYSSIPLLERGLSDNGGDLSPRETRDWSQRSVLRDASGERVDRNGDIVESSHGNPFNPMEVTENVEEVAAVDTVPNQEIGDESFLNSESDDRSDLSSELSVEVVDQTDYNARDSTAASTVTFPAVHPGTIVKEIPTHGHPPSPPITLTQALRLSPTVGNVQWSSQAQLQRDQTGLPPTPEFTPTVDGTNEDHTVDRGATPSIDPLRSHLIPEASRKTSIHLPFVLAFDSGILAQQFTLIEKDALNEIDWKDLIEMHWKDATAEPRSWVEFLRTSEPRGVEVVIARFNLVVKWAISECVLTENLEERVRTITKFIHIAAHCRKYRNFATMTQLTVALTSQELSRLTTTWASVPADDKQTLKQLEELVSPTSNFHSMRAEMEGSGTEQGCIPFVGIYTHDLLINSERPSQIASTPTTEPLVNFERCRIDAAIVKNLLRLLEASHLYRFLPIEGITERCLWMAALSDEEITKYGRIIQQ